MGPMNFNLYSDAPTMILPPSQDSPFYQPLDSRPSFVPGTASQNVLSTEPSTLSADSTSSPASDNFTAHRSSRTPTTATTPIYTNPSRKRSRDESALIDDGGDTPDTSYFPLTPAPPTIPEEEPIYGEGMTILNPSTGVSLSAESQTGTWYEETAEVVAIAASTPLTSTVGRSEMPSRKSQRLDVSAPSLDDIAASVVYPESPPKSAPTDPTIDESTQALGIGWKKISDEDEHLQAAARGWAKYIENHYTDHVRGARILLKSEGLNAYLVGAAEGFFLFREDLGEGRLVGSTWERTLARLMLGGGNVQFEGETLSAHKGPASPMAPISEGEKDHPMMMNGDEDIGTEQVVPMDQLSNGHQPMPRTSGSNTDMASTHHVGVEGGMDLD